MTERFFASTSGPMGGPDRTHGGSQTFWPAQLLLGLGYILIHIFLDAHAYAFRTVHSVTIWYPPLGFALAFLHITGMKQAPSVAIGFILGNLAVWEDWTLTAGTIIAPLFNAAAAITAAWLLSTRPSLIGRRWTLRDLAAFVLVCLLATCISGIGVLGFWTATGRLAPEGFTPTLSDWVVGDMIALLVLTPFILVAIAPIFLNFQNVGIGQAVKAGIRWTGRHWTIVLETVAFFAFTVLLVQRVFQPAPIAGQTLFFLCFLPVLWAVLRYGFVGAVLIAGFIDMAGLTIALQESGLSSDIPSRNAILVFQLFTIILALVAYTLGAVVDERRAARKDVERQKDRLEDMVEQRTKELLFENEERKRVESSLRRLNDMLEKRVADRTRALNAARKKAEQANEAKTQFLQNMSHELRTPLNAIIGFAQMLEHEKAVDKNEERRKVYAHDIHAAGVHLLALVDDLLDMASLDSENEQPLAFYPVNLNEMLATACRLAEPKALKKSVTLTMEVDEADIMLKADAHRLLQIFLNLIGNAVKFSPEGETVQINATRRDKDAFIEITDHGPGISEEDRKLVFERFWRGNSSVYTEGGGMGLGLSIARSLIEKHGGSIEISSGAKSGTVISVRLPLCPSPEDGREI